MPRKRSLPPISMHTACMGRTVEQLRRQRAMTQTEVVEKIDKASRKLGLSNFSMSVSKLSRIERGLDRFDAQTVLALSHAFRVGPEVVLKIPRLLHRTEHRKIAS